MPERRFRLAYHSAQDGARIAQIMGRSGLTMTFAELERRSARLAQYLVANGLKVGDHIAVMMENHPNYLEVCWAALRAGLYYTPVNWHLTSGEAAYIVEDCGARAFFVSPAVAPVAEELRRTLPDSVEIRLSMGRIDGYQEYDAALGASPDTPLAHELKGGAMYYTSGTTGRPKGVLRPLSGMEFGAENPMEFLARRFGFDRDTVYLSPAPLYHAAPNSWSMMTQRVGGTTIVMESFEAEEALSLIERYRVTHAQFVPTMFVRMLKLPAEIRARYDLSSLRMAIHAAAACPVHVKWAMLEWWGTIIHEYWASSDGAGIAWISPEEWIAHPGSVGQPERFPIHIVGEDGREVPTGEMGTIYADGPTINYHNDPVKTAASYNQNGWATVGDMGYLDEDGYLYIVDRRDDMIISGGVNIYPQEIEDVMIQHRKVADVAVIGVPNEEFGQEVKAVVQLEPTAVANATLEADLIEWVRARLSHYKCPRSVDFVKEFPRMPNGKLLRRRLREGYSEVRQ